MIILNFYLLIFFKKRPLLESIQCINEKNELKSALSETKMWYEKSRDELPDTVKMLVEFSIKYIETYKDDIQKSYNILSELRRSMGILPKSEKMSALLKDQGNLINGQLETEETKLSEEENKKRIGLRRKIFKLMRQWERLPKRNKNKLKLFNNIKPINMDSKNNSDLDINVKADKELQLVEETVFDTSSSYVQDNEQKIQVSKGMEFSNEKGLISKYDERVRYDVKLLITKTTYKVETVTSPTTGKSVTAKVTDGPAGTQYTWETVTSLIQFTVGYCIPMNRLSKMLGGGFFSSSQIWYILRDAAKAFLPIYMNLFEEMSDSYLLSGDDTPVLVLESKKAEPQEENSSASDDSILPEEKNKKISEILNERFGFKFPYANKKGKKKQIYVSLLTGKTVLKDRRSTVVFYRSHFGNLGNLVSTLLESRSPKYEQLLFQSDLLSGNTPVIPTKIILTPSLTSYVNEKGENLEPLFKIVHAGCAAHARRAIAKYWKDDPVLCVDLLSRFNCLANLEKNIDMFGRTKERVLRVRQKWCRKVWNSILKMCKEHVDNHSEKSHLGKGLRYIIRNYEKLIRYLDYPHIEFTNNNRERLLRYEALLESSAKFRKTFEGRAVFDILRTIISTATAAEINLQEYLQYVIKNKEKAALEPEKYTPYAFALLKDKEKQQQTL